MTDFVATQPDFFYQHARGLATKSIRILPCMTRLHYLGLHSYIHLFLLPSGVKFLSHILLMYTRAREDRKKEWFISPFMVSVISLSPSHATYFSYNDAQAYTHTTACSLISPVWFFVCTECLCKCHLGIKGHFCEHQAITRERKHFYSVPIKPPLTIYP